MLFPKDFFVIQFEFARKVRNVTGSSIAESLFTYTSVPIRFGISFAQLTVDNPVWTEFLARVERDKNILDIIYTYHKETMKNAPPMRPQYGCFSYDISEEKKAVRLHFANNDEPEPGALSEERMSQRLKELRIMFTDIHAKHPTYTFVISSSWLYHIPAFTRLFPKSFTENGNIVENHYNSLGLWGQFINKYGNIKQDMKDKFLDSVRKAHTMEDLENSFPLKELKAEADISDFYTFYNLV